MDEDTDPVEPATGTPNHPIEVSDGSSFHGSPYRGPDSYQARFNQYEWYFTPSHHSSPHQQQQQQQDPSEDSHFVAVTPPPPPPAVYQAPPEPPRRRRSGVRMSVREGGFHFSTPHHSSGSHYPPLQEDPLMGGPSVPASEVNSTPIAPPPSGFGNPIPTYAGSTAYNPFE
ncbi:ALG-2 interacting protein X-like [Helianthus annuus]|uniref:ALG-2 interacting protein X-like n=1 Tax=Helianthus annuus TaxID=4232 RepID=UPI000B8EFF10|nr:ALG-2 interacting protein X-like [Helianthus annuus]